MGRPQRGVGAVATQVAAVPGADPTGVLNRYALPKVAMVLIATAAAVGTVLSTAIGPDAMGYAAAVARYLLLMGLATADGGLLWAWKVVMPAARQMGGGASERYALRQWTMFRRLERLAFAVSAAALAALAPAYWVAPPLGRGAERLVLGLAAIALVLWGATLRSRPAPTTDAAGHEALKTLAVVTLLLVAVGALQVGYGAPVVRVELLWRTLHLAAFAAWFGGAVWNVGIAVRCARQDLSVAVVRTAHVQLARFRRIVRVAFPLLVVTGLLQVWQHGGFYASALAGSFDHLAAVKLGVALLLVVVFISCPLWHACSPIAGICDPRDLPGGRGSGGSESGTHAAT